MRYDRQGDQHYDVISAFIKSIRGSDADAALHYLARMIEAGEDPRFIARRLMILASEDIGLADPTALATAVAAAQAVQLIGMPEAQLNLAHATIALAVAPKSNAVTTAIGAALADVRAGKIGQVPPHLRDAHYAGRQEARPRLDVQVQPRRAVRHRRAAVRPRRRRSTREYYQPTSLGAEAVDQGALGADRVSAAAGSIRGRWAAIGSVTMQDWIVPAVAGVLALVALRPRRRAAARPLAHRPGARRSAQAETAELRAQVDGARAPARPARRARCPRRRVRDHRPRPGARPDADAEQPARAGRAPRSSPTWCSARRVVKAASLAHGVRRALDPETRNRIRFEMRREVKRARKQRRADTREARREWEARQRADPATTTRSSAA